jgi:exopolysaccharide biosynthesis polyprenyl glycosylphosphotransferase
MEITQMSAEAPAAIAPVSAPLPSSVPALERSGPKRLRARGLWALTCFSVDGASLAAAAGASMVGAAESSLAWRFDSWTFLFIALTLYLFRSRALYELRIKIEVLDDVRAIACATTLAAMTVLTLRLLVDASPSLALEIVRPWAFGLVYVSAGRVALYWSQTKARIMGEAGRRTLVIGGGRVAELLANRLAERPEYGLRVVGFLEDRPPSDCDELPCPVLGGAADLEDIVEGKAVEHVIVAFSTLDDEELLELVNRAERLGVGISVVPRLYEKVPERLRVEHLGGLPLLTGNPANPKGWQFRVKYALDRALAAVLLLLASPVLLACAAAVRLTMGRPVLFRQSRVGLDGKEFDVLKFRSMRDAPAASEADAAWLAKQLSAASGDVVVFDGDNRRTPVGTFLRRMSLDELPQLLNVLKGDMSLVGPRPERTSYVRQFEQRIYRYGDRHRVKSGITGWAQVHGLRGDTSLGDRIEWDNFYVENFSLWLDLKILLMTVKAVIGTANAK